MDGLVAVETEDDMQSTETNITLEREKANQYGIETQMISGAISYTIRGNQVGYYYDSNGRRNRIRIWLGKNDRESINHVRKFPFEGSDGALVPLASLSYESGARAIRRQDRKTVMRVQEIATEEDSTELLKQRTLLVRVVRVVWLRTRRWFNSVSSHHPNNRFHRLKRRLKVSRTVTLRD